MNASSDMFDRDGRPIDVRTYARLAEQADYKVLKQTTLPSGYRVSTVWLGVNHRWEHYGAPLIFETMVFRGEDVHEVNCERYTNELAAYAGHEALCAQYEQAK